MLKSEARTTVLRTGLTTMAVAHTVAPDDEILAIGFKAGSFMALMPGDELRSEAGNAIGARQRRPLRCA